MLAQCLNSAILILLSLVSTKITDYFLGGPFQSGWYVELARECLFFSQFSRNLFQCKYLKESAMSPSKTKLLC